MEVDRDAVNRALDLMLSLDDSSSLSVNRFICNNKVVDNEVELLVHYKKDLNKVLAKFPRLKKYSGGSGQVHAKGNFDGVHVKVLDVCKCEVTYEEVEEPEMAPTGKTVKVKKPVYNCPEGDIVRK